MLVQQLKQSGWETVYRNGMKGSILGDQTKRCSVADEQKKIWYLAELRGIINEAAWIVDWMMHVYKSLLCILILRKLPISLILLILFFVA